MPGFVKDFEQQKEDENSEELLIVKTFRTSDGSITIDGIRLTASHMAVQGGLAKSRLFLNCEQGEPAAWFCILSRFMTGDSAGVG